jgi:cytochrome c peroxidase
MINKAIIVTAAALIAIILLTAGTIDLNNLYNYSNQAYPLYITKDNTPSANLTTNAGATLGRVLFYDKQLSANGTISCASCHKQAFAFGDTAQQSVGLNGGLTGRHSMRLINSRFATESRFFWDERANSLEDQTTRPIQDHVEMGFSASNGDPDFDSLIRRLEAIPYYQQLFTFVYGTPQISETKIQNALAQFIRSIQSFDSKFDIGRAQAPNDAAPFTNYTADENAGKQLFLTPPPQGGAGCQGCHRAPEFDIDPASQNNGVVAVAGSTTTIDITNTRAPSLRDIFNSAGVLNGPLMHNGNFTTIEQVIDHYNLVPNTPGNTNLDPRVAGPGGNLQLTQQQKNQLIAFLKTLSGNDVYTNQKWSNPFDANGNINVIPLTTGIKKNMNAAEFNIYPNPATYYVNIALPNGNYQIKAYNTNGQEVLNEKAIHSAQIDISHLEKGIYIFNIVNLENKENFTKKIIKR